MMRTERRDLARAIYSRNGEGWVIVVRRNGGKVGYYLPSLIGRARVARALRAARVLLTKP